MPTFKEYQQTAKSRGALAIELFVAVSKPVVPPDQMAEHLPAHLEYLKGLEAEGSLMMAGPMSDLAGENIEGMGMLILRASTWEEAQKLADGDPMHKSGARQYELRRWLLNEGNLQLSVGLSTRAISV